MDASKTIAHEIGGIQNDALRFGLHGVKSDILEAHPLESAYQSAKDNQADMNKKILANTYGSAFPLKMDLDRQILSRCYDDFKEWLCSCNRKNIPSLYNAIVQQRYKGVSLLLRHK